MVFKAFQTIRSFNLEERVFNELDDDPFEEYLTAAAFSMPKCISPDTWTLSGPNGKSNLFTELIMR
jgi:hypothetical protein